MNGSIGRVLAVDPGSDDAACVDLDGAAVDLAPRDWQYVERAFAITVHKSQGSQFDRVVIPVTRSRLLDRALVYTSVTRGVRQVVIVGDAGALKDAITAPPLSYQRAVGSSLRLGAVCPG